MNIYLYKLAKRVNSTKRPTGSGTLFECTLKQPTSIMSPDIMINIGNMTNIPDFNYAYIPQFNRYYHITDITSMGHLWNLSMVCDVLATYRTEIGAADLYMLRSTAAYNGNVIDNFYPMLADYTVDIERQETPWPHWDLEEPSIPNWQIKVNAGVFVLGVLAIPESGGGGSYGSIKYLGLSAGAMRTLISYLMGNTIWNDTDFDVEGATMSVTKALINPLSYIKSCQWAPIEYDDLIGTEVGTVTIWDWSVTLPSGTSCKIMNSNPSIYNMKRITLSRHPQASRGAYLNTSPYSIYTLVYPPYGMVTLDSMDLLKTDRIQLESIVDLITGEGRLDVYTTAENNGSVIRDRLINRIRSQVCVPIQLSEVGYDYTNKAATIIGTGAGWLGNWLKGFDSAASSGLAGAVSQVGNLANATRQRVSSVGSSGNFCDLDGWLELIQEFYQIASEDFTHVGRPLCQIRKASAGSSGDYYLAREGDLGISGATSAEQEEIKGFLESGFFWE